MGWYYEKGQAGLAGWYTILDTSAAQYITVFEIMSKLLFICTLGCFELRFLHSAPLNPCCSVASCVPWAPASSPVVFWFVLSFCTALIFFFFCWQFLLLVFLVLALLDFYLRACLCVWCLGPFFVSAVTPALTEEEVSLCVCFQPHEKISLQVSSGFTLVTVVTSLAASMSTSVHPPPDMSW